MKKIKLTYTVTVADTVTAREADKWLWNVIRNTEEELPEDIYMITLTPEVTEEEDK